MIIYDGIIEKLQAMGGVTVLFQQLLMRSDVDNIGYFSYVDNSSIFLEEKNITMIKPRIFERYRDFQFEVREDDIFHSTYYRLPGFKTNIITTVHDFTYEKFVKGLPKTIHSWQKYKAIHNSDHIICVSHNTAKDLQSYCNVSSNKISVVHNGVALDYSPLDIEYTENVLFVGGRAGYKNFDKAVDAIALSSKFNLNIVGSPLSPEELAFLNVKLPNRYTYLGKLTNMELNVEYNKAYALLYPSNYEGFGIPALEAMSAGCPVIAVNCSSLPEVVGNAGILLDDSEPNLIHEALVELGNIRYELIQCGYVQAKKFSWDKCYSETQNVYKKFL